MDGYEDPNSTKKAEKARRIKGNVARDIVFTGKTELSNCSKTEFLNNSINKQNFIKLLSIRLRREGYEVTECIGDADYDIAEAALSLAESSDNPVILDTSDTDILTMLVANDRENDNLIMQSTVRFKIA